MFEECYCCGPSWTGTVNSIAVFDLFTAALQITFETASLGVLSGLLVPFNNSREARENCTDTGNGTSNCPWLYTYFGMNDHYIHLNFDTFVVSLVILSIFVGFILEGYLFSLLRKATHEKIYKLCRRWCRLRAAILLLVTFASFAKYWNESYYIPIDGLLDCFKAYRLITLVIVYKFMDEIRHTVGVIYIKPPKRPKRGSL